MFKMRTKLIMTGFISVFLAMILIGISGNVSMENTHSNMHISALTTESGKAQFIGNYELNVSFKAFPDQSTGKVYYSLNSTITDTSPSVNFTTANYTILTGLEIGTYYILIQNGTTFPSTIYEFTGTVPISSVVESFHYTYLGNGQFNISWVKFPSQSVVRVYYAFGNITNLTASSNFVIGSSLSYLTVSIANMSNKNIDFLLVNDSLFPKGELNVSSYIQIYSPIHHGLLIAFNGYGIFLDYAWLIILAIVLILIGIAVHKHDEHKRE